MISGYCHRPVKVNKRKSSARKSFVQPTSIKENIVEIVSDSGEGAQKCGQTFGNISAKMNNGVWTVEIIPAEIQPPARTPSGASGIRIRFGSKYMTNVGNEGDLVVAFNEQVLYSRIANGAYKKGTIVLLDNRWESDASTEIQEMYRKAVVEFREHGLVVHELPIHEACLEVVKDPRKGKNMFVLGMLCRIYNRDKEMSRNEIAITFAGKKNAIITSNQNLFDAGYAFAEKHVGDYFFDIPPAEEMGSQKMVVTNGNTAIGLGVMASGMELVSMYPITPATSASHYLADVYPAAGGFVHQAEDEIAAIAFAIGASYAGKTACTITSGPGMALKTENIALAVMAEIPLVIVDVQRGGPSTGLPTKIEQGDLLSSLYGMPGDAPKIILAAATIAECFSMVVLARKLAETFRTPVIVLTDANLATGVQPWVRPELSRDMLAPPLDQSEWNPDVPAYDWDEKTGLSQRPIPGMPRGEYVLTGLSHTKQSKVSYESTENQHSTSMRSRKLATLQSTLTPPEIHGDESGDLLVVGWGSTYGAINEAIDNLREKGSKVSSIHLRFLSPLEPGLKEIFSRFKKVITVEVNYSDDPKAPMITDENRRYAQLASILRIQTLVDVDCWSVVYGHPLQPELIENAIQERLDQVTDNRSSQDKGE
ncbi:MAG: 2-oxoacid:acceptor oxidoreductase subunit alpha [Gammaproteobacteria bacterium]|uniref:2-oxoacid:acceptor oxidoreductase subunit alpha n=1 Tax=Candidatus Thiopontia autotrophica TaxID=2841688 RepID=A0A8J6PAD6_9GAMM|nr:2-oxoacid:acceptor oxidoreductase subunit alpha [Candidatus Thiopontia autotrophica]MBL6968667.1 2-oxoacid:acceptor oxidoreductase subunit alpha [Gammaproteobacteria bacterium]